MAQTSPPSSLLSLPRLTLAELPEGVRHEMRAAAAAAYPAECCGLLVEASNALQYWPCGNEAPFDEQGERFVLNPADWAAAEDAGCIRAVVHSHPNATANPSSADRVRCERSGLPWLIVGWPSGVMVALQPEGWSAPLIGREFAFGVLDCYTVIQDWYQRELGLALPDFDREDGFWETKRLPDGTVQRGRELYLEGFAEAGFAALPPGAALRRGDVILMQVASDVTNHGAVYLGDGEMLHHLHGRLSCRDPYGGYWLRHTRVVVRHQGQAEVAP